MIRKIMRPLFNALKVAEAKGIHDLDAVETTALHGAILRKKPFMVKLYRDFYAELLAPFGDLGEAKIVEIGSGAGFMKEMFPAVTTSDVLSSPGIDMEFSGTSMPFADGSVDGFVMLDVLHHVNRPSVFLKEMSRCLGANGKIVMLEPANTPFSRFFYQHVHHEAFDVSSDWDWECDSRLTSTNQALPWILFFRDRARFEAQFPELRIARLENHTPFRYVLSGGMSLKQLVPGGLYGMVKALEKALLPLNNYLGMFLTIELHKSGPAVHG